MEASCGPDSADGRQLDRAGLDRNTGTSHLVSAISYRQNIFKLEENRQDKTSFILDIDVIFLWTFIGRIS